MPSETSLVSVAAQIKFAGIHGPEAVKACNHRLEKIFITGSVQDVLNQGKETVRKASKLVKILIGTDDDFSETGAEIIKDSATLLDDLKTIQPNKGDGTRVIQLFKPIHIEIERHINMDWEVSYNDARTLFNSVYDTFKKSNFKDKSTFDTAFRDSKGVLSLDNALIEGKDLLAFLVDSSKKIVKDVLPVLKNTNPFPASFTGQNLSNENFAIPKMEKFVKDHVDKISTGIGIILQATKELNSVLRKIFDSESGFEIDKKKLKALITDIEKLERRATPLFKKVVTKLVAGGSGISNVQDLLAKESEKVDRATRTATQLKQRFTDQEDDHDEILQECQNQLDNGGNIAAIVAKTDFVLPDYVAYKGPFH